jgi:RNA polymerase sigma-70 factor, ECF subfamily
MVPATLTRPARPRWALPPRCRDAGGQASVLRVEVTDALLAARLAAGDERALGEIFDRLGAVVYGASLRVLGDAAAAQDVAQDVFVELWCHPSRYDPAAGTLRTYLAMLARHRAIDLVRGELRRIARQERNHRLSPEQPPPLPSDEVVAAEAASMVRAAVELLPEGQRQVIELAYFGGLSYREVAVAAGIPEGTAKSRLRLALARLETVLDRQLLDLS